MSRTLKRKHKNFMAMMGCCRDVFRVLSSSRLATEAACAIRIHAPPEVFHRTVWPCIAQFEKEKGNLCILKCLYSGVVSLATHCATDHCTRTRREMHLQEKKHPLGAKMEIADACAYKIALAGSRAFFFCKKGLRMWIVAVDMSPQMAELARVVIDDSVLRMRASCDLLVFSTARGIWTWDPFGELKPLYVPPFADVADFWVGSGHVKLALTWNSSISVSTSIAHAGHGEEIHRLTNAQTGCRFKYACVSANEDSSLVLVGVTSRTIKAEMQIYDVENDTTHSLCFSNKRIVEFCLNASGNCACIFESNPGTPHTRVTIHIYVQRHFGIWARISRQFDGLTVGPTWCDSTWWSSWHKSRAVFMSCGRRIVFFGPLFTSRVSICSIELDTIDFQESGIRLYSRNCTLEALPKLIICSNTCTLLQTHRGALSLRATQVLQQSDGQIAGQARHS